MCYSGRSPLSRYNGDLLYVRAIIFICYILLGTKQERRRIVDVALVVKSDEPR